MKTTSTAHMSDIALCRRYIQSVDSARDRNIEFTLTFCAYKNLLKRKICPYSGKPLITTGKDRNISIDRIDNTKGYIPGNVIACDRLTNNQKDNLTVDTIYAIAKVCKQAQKKK